ncbi:MAG TPA: protein-glutamate O-methyltransferase CheR [Gemmatimonadales bacterium]
MTTLQAPEDGAAGLDDGFAALTELIAATTGFRCGSYKERCLRRRLAVRMRARGVHTYDDYVRVLGGDPREWDRLLDALTINVTRLFRDPAAYAGIEREVVPRLWACGTGPIRAWSAGCSSGDEAYSLAVLFHRHAESLGQADCLDRVSIVGTDIDRGSLEAAALGRYPESAFADVPPELRARYFTGGSPAEVVPELRAMTRFERRDLLHEPPPADDLDLILCRNVLIYFDRETQERLFSTFRDALRPGGFLVLGKVETLLGDSRRGFIPVLARERVFRRT